MLGISWRLEARLLRQELEISATRLPQTGKKMNPYNLTKKFKRPVLF